MGCNRAALSSPERAIHMAGSPKTTQAANDNVSKALALTWRFALTNENYFVRFLEGQYIVVYSFLNALGCTRCCASVRCLRSDQVPLRIHSFLSPSRIILSVRKAGSLFGTGCGIYSSG